MDEDSAVTSHYLFRGIEYIVTMQISGDTVTLEVEDKLTADQWRGTFDANYVEDLTHKTGNFKQFAIFVNMIETALSKSSDAVSLDLLTYSDLESLRSRKAGVGTKAIPGAKAHMMNTSKRYLILTYTVEFDKIHYPLPLPYQGKPDPRALQETIRQLRTELKFCKQKGSSDYRLRELEKLKRDHDLLLKEKDALEEEYLRFRREMKLTTKGTAAKEVKILKTMVKNLEEELLKERTKNQKMSSKRNAEYRQLSEEYEEIRAAERNLRIRVKSLTNELAVYKRRPVKSPASSQASTRKEVERRRAASRERSFSRERSYARDRERSSSAERSFVRRQAYSAQLDRRRPRSASADRRQERSASIERSRRERSLSQDRNVNRRRSPSASPSGARLPRFDPTAYVKEKARRKRETDMSSQRQARSRRSGSSERQPMSSPGYVNSISRTFDGGYKKFRFRTNSVGSQGSQSDADVASDSSTSRVRKLKKVLRPGRASSSSFWDSPNVPYHKNVKKSGGKHKIVSSTPTNGILSNKKKGSTSKENRPPMGQDKDAFNRSAEITEIDARLNRLQQYMQSNMPLN
ncbi:centrosomal protein CCDC61-like [Lineus longissimus]|uniref:centrosomal protein CCDC61-like n=1 Tax=Lineus longissimus TaxID=88925 RepID=UPI002B4ECD89